MKENDYYILLGPTTCYVKTAHFFADQGGHHAEWGKAWTKIKATSIDEARAKGMRMLRNDKLPKVYGGPQVHIDYARNRHMGKC